MAWGDITNPEAWKSAMANILRRGGEVVDYVEQAPQKAGQAILEGHAKNQELWQKAHANPQRPFQVTDQNAFNELNDRYLSGVTSIAPIGMTKPLSEAEFLKNYQQHIDIKNRIDQLGEERAKKIAEEGFKQGFGVNTLPVYKGGQPKNIIDKVYAPKSGDYVYLVPNEFADKLGSGYKVQEKWIPKSHEVLKIESDYPSLYEEYLKQFNK